MTDADLTLRDEVAEVLAEHREDAAYPDTCVCETAIPGYLDGHYAHHLADALLPLLARVREEGRADAHRVVFHIGTGHVVCACGWVGQTDNITGLNGVQKYGQHRAALAEPTGEDAA